MSKIRNTVKKVLSIALVAMMSVSLFGCNFFFGGSGTASSSSSSSKKPGGITVGGDSSSLGIGNQNAFDKNDFLTFPASFAEDDDDYKNVGGYDIIIQAGQSNAEGNGWGYLETPFQPNDNILYFADAFQLGGSINEEFSVMPAQEKRSNATGNLKNEFALSFAQEYLYSDLYYQGRKILIVRAAVGATGFSNNGINDYTWLPNDNLYPRMVKAVQDALNLEFSATGEYKNRLVAFLWHQGETDAHNFMSENTYYNHLATLLTNFKTTFECPDLPFICADFVQDWKQNRGEIKNYAPLISNAQKRICEDFAPAAYLHTYGLKSNKEDPTHPTNEDPSLVITIDDIHFCREAVHLLGQKYFLAYQALFNARKTVSE